MKATMIFLILLMLTAFAFGGYLLGEYEAKKNMSNRILNEWFWMEEDRPQVYREGFVFLPKTERDSLYQNALNLMP